MAYADMALNGPHLALSLIKVDQRQIKGASMLRVPLFRATVKAPYYIYNGMLFSDDSPDFLSDMSGTQASDARLIFEQAHQQLQQNPLADVNSDDSPYLPPRGNGEIDLLYAVRFLLKELHSAAGRCGHKHAI